MTDKEIIKRCARWLATPWRQANQRKYADPESDSMRHQEFPNDQLLPVVSEYIARGEAVVIRVKGYSMRPFLEHLRDRVELAPWQTLHVGDAVLAEYAPGRFVLHRIIAIDGDRLTLKGDGNLRGVEHCTLADVRGLLTRYLRPGGHVMNADDLRLKRRIKLWGKLPTCVRRVFLFIYNQTV